MGEPKIVRNPQLPSAREVEPAAPAGKVQLEEPVVAPTTDEITAPVTRPELPPETPLVAHGLGFAVHAPPAYHLKTQARLVNQARAFDVKSAHPDYQFPPEFAKVHEGAQLLAVGDGDWYHGWDAVEYRLNVMTDDEGRTRQVFDPRYLTDGKVDLGKVTAAERKPERMGTLVDALDAKEVRGNALVLSPNRFHVPQTEQLVRNPNITGVYVEKPMATGLEDLEQLDAVVKTADKPMYFGDHYVFAAAPLLALMGKALPGENLVQITSDPTGKLRAALESRQPLVHSVRAIDAKTEFPGSDNLLHRSWLQKASMGGGVMLDLQVHLENVIRQLGFAPGRVDAVTRQVRPIGDHVPLDTWVPIDPNADVAEDFAHVSSTLDGGEKLELEVAQFASGTDNHVILTGDDGWKLKMNLESRTVQYLDPGGNVQGEAKLAADPVLLMMHHALSYFESGDMAPMFYAEQRDSIRAIEAAKAFAR